MERVGDVELAPVVVIAADDHGMAGEVLIGVAENAVRDLRVGQSATVSLWSAPDQRYDAYVREIAPAADQSRTFQVKVALRDRSQAIQLGQSARVYFQTATDAQLSIPLSSVSAIDEKPYVWVINPNQTLKRTWVQLGEYKHDRVPVMAGLQPDQWVVVGGVHLLREKQKVRLVDVNNRPVSLEDKTIQQSNNQTQTSPIQKASVSTQKTTSES